MLQLKINPGTIRFRAVILLGLFVLIIGCAQTVDYTYLQQFNKNKYPQADAIIVNDSTHIDLQENGKYVSQHYKLVKILTMKGKAQFSEVSVGYFTKYDTVIVEKANVINADGSVIEVEPESIKDVKIPAFGKFFLPSVRMKKITFPEVKEGSSIEYCIKDIVSNPPKDDDFNSIQLFENDNPILNKVYEIKTSMELDWIVENKPKLVKDVVQDEGKKKLYKWKVTDVPAYRKEPLMPPPQNVLAKLVVSSVSSWPEWSRWCYQLCQDKIKTTPEMDTLVDSLLVDKKTRIDSIKSLYYWVSQNIRYVGTKMSGKKGGYEPFPAAETFKKKYGVCRDKAALLAALYKQAGFDAYVVLINPMLDIKADIPHVSEFNHAITAIKNRDGSYLYIDGTAENTSELLLTIEQDKAVLIATPQGEEILYTPKLPAESSKFSIIAQGEIDKENKLQEKLVMKTTGLMGMAFRQILTKIPAEQSKMIFNKMITGMCNQAKLDTFYHTDPENLDKPLELTFKISAEDFGLKLDKEFSFKFPLSTSGGATVSSTMGAGQNPFANDERVYPLNLYSTMQTEINETIRIPQNYQIKNLPESIVRGSENFFVESRYSAKNSSIQHKMVTSFEDYIFLPEEYKKMKEIMDKLSQLGEQEIILEQKGEKQ